jgi:competence protein ComEA
MTRAVAPPTGNGSTIPIRLSCIFQQLPTQLLAPNAREQIDSTTIRLPADWVLPQLAAGKVVLPLAKLLPLLPLSILRSPPPITNAQQSITLPLEEVVTALPANLLAHQDQTTLDINTPEFDKLPKLFDDDLAKIPDQEEPVVAIVEPTIPASPAVTETSEEAIPLAPPPPAFFVAPSPALSEVAEPSAKSTSPTSPPADDKVMVSLRSLVAVMPDQYFICPRTELWRRIDLDTRVPLPRDVVLPQLQMARVRIPLAVAVEAMPTSILASPLPSIGNESVPLALQEIVPQLPPGLFMTAATQSDEETLDFSESEIPMPFKEKILTGGEPATEVTAPAESGISEPSQPEPETEPKVFEAATEVFADESLSIFAEKAATPEPPAAANVEAPSEPVPEIVAELPAPAIEVEEKVSPVAETSTAETVAEVIPPAPAPTDAPLAVTAEQPATPIESLSEPAEVPVAVAEIPAVSEAVQETVVPEVQQVVTATPIESVSEPSEVSVAAAGIPAVSEAVQETIVPEVQPVVTATPIESVSEPSEVPVAATEIPAVSEAVQESVVPAEQQVVTATSEAAPTENKFLVNLNQCTAEDLAKIEGVGPVLAQRIIEFRTAQGGFKSAKELRHVPGINRKTLRTLTGPAPRTLNRLLGVEHNEELTLQEIVRLTSQLKGVAGCILAMSDGVFLTGQLPPHLDQETISVFAPQLFKKVGRYMKELRVGQVTRLSVFTDQQPLSIFHAGDIFLVVIHDPSHFSKALLRRCERISQEIARLCRQRAVV